MGVMLLGAKYESHMSQAGHAVWTERNSVTTYNGVQGAGYMFQP